MIGFKDKEDLADFHKEKTTTNTIIWSSFILTILIIIACTSSGAYFSVTFVKQNELEAVRRNLDNELNKFKMDYKRSERDWVSLLRLEMNSRISAAGTDYVQVRCKRSLSIND